MAFQSDLINRGWIAHLNVLVEKKVYVGTLPSVFALGYMIKFQLSILMEGR